MKIQIFQHLPTLPKAGIFCSLPILCVAFRTFIPERSVFRCFPLPCLSMFRPLVPMHKSAHSVTHPAAPPSHACASHTPITPQFPAHQHPPSRFTHRPSDASTKGQRTRPRRYTAYCFSKPHTPAKKPPPPHTQASKKDCPAQEQSFL